RRATSPTIVVPLPHLWPRSPSRRRAGTRTPPDAPCVLHPAPSRQVLGLEGPLGPGQGRPNRAGGDAAAGGEPGVAQRLGGQHEAGALALGELEEGEADGLALLGPVG